MTFRNVFKFVVTLALVFALAGGYGVFTAKASMKSASSVRGTGVSTAVATPNVKISKTRNVFGDSGVTLAPGVLTLIDGTDISCPDSCYFEADNNQQVLASATSNIALLSAVDGNFIGLGAFLGPAGTDYQAFSWTDFSESSFPSGSHSIVTYAYSRDADALAVWYNFTYRAYKVP